MRLDFVTQICPNVNGSSNNGASIDIKNQFTSKYNYKDNDFCTDRARVENITFPAGSPSDMISISEWFGVDVFDITSFHAYFEDTDIATVNSNDLRLDIQLGGFRAQMSQMTLVNLRSIASDDIVIYTPKIPQSRDFVLVIAITLKKRIPITNSTSSKK